MSEPQDTSVPGPTAAWPQELAPLLEVFASGGPDGMALLDRDLRFRWVNDALARLGGLRPEEHVGRSFADTLPELALVVEPLLRLAAQGEGKVLQREIETVPPLGGAAVWWLVRCYSLRAAEAEAIAVALIDITERKSVERRLADERTLFDTVLLQLPTGVIIAEAPSGAFRLLNPAAHRTLGRSALEAKGVSDGAAFGLLHLDGTPYRAEEFPLARAIRAGEVVYDEDHLLITRDGTRVHLRCSATPVRDPSGRIIAGVTTLLDVSERERAEEDLRMREQRLRLLVDSVQDYAIFIVDPDGRIVSWPSGAERMTGYSAHEAIGRQHFILFPQEELLLGRPDQMLRSAAEMGRYEEEGWRLRKDRSRFWVHLTVTAMRDEEGRLRGFSKIIRDYTDRKLTEDALRESNHRVITILESISDAFYAVDRQWNCILVNSEAERLLGRRREELIGLQMLDHLDGADEIFRRELERAMREGVRVEFEGYHRRVGRWLDVRAYPSEVGLSIYFRDATGCRRTAQAQQLLADTGRLLTESLDYEVTLERVTAAAVPQLADACGALVREEDGSFSITATHREPAAASRLRELIRRFPPRDDAPVGMGSVLRTGESILVPVVDESFLSAVAQSPEHLAVLRSLGFVAMMVVPLRARGRSLGVMVFATENHQHRYDEADLRLAEELGRRAGLAVDNARLYREAQAAIQAREDIVSVASHDLKSPLTSMKLRVESLLQGTRAAQAPTPEVQRASLESVARQLDRMVGLIDSLLEISRLESGRLDLHPEPLDAAALVREVVERHQAQVEKSGSLLALHADAPVVGRWDRRRLEQVVTNLLTNALKYGEGRPVEISVTGDPLAAHLRVRDHGVGIPPEEQERIFERFRRASTGQGLEGVGLGLWIVRRVVEAMGGAVGVESRPGQGSTFTVDLPRAGPG